MGVGGYKPKKTRRDFVAEKVTAFGLATPQIPKPLGRLDEILASPLVKYPLYQGAVPSCVAASASFLNQYNSWREKEAKHFSWPYLYGNVKQYPQGTVPQDIFNVLRKKGQCTNEKLPQEKYNQNPENGFFLTPDNISLEANEEALWYQISNFFFLKSLDKTTIYNALVQQPLFVGLWVDPQTWNYQDIITPGRKTYGHMVVLVDIDENWNWKVISWDKKDGLDVRTLDKEYPFVQCGFIRDLPDGVSKDDIRRGGFLQNFLSVLWLV